MMIIKTHFVRSANQAFNFRSFCFLYQLFTRLKIKTSLNQTSSQNDRWLSQSSIGESGFRCTGEVLKFIGLKIDMIAMQILAKSDP